MAMARGGIKSLKYKAYAVGPIRCRGSHIVSGAVLPHTKQCFPSSYFTAMKGCIFTTCVLTICLLCGVAYAQSPLAIVPYAFENILDTVAFRVGYRLTYVPDTSRANHTKTQELELLLGKRYEQFRVNTEGYDNAYPTPKGSGTHISGEGLAASVFILDRRLGQRQAFIKGVAPSVLSYVETATQPRWEMRVETQDILGYTCQKAVTQYLGRYYTAWFTSEIPVASGPWKLGGLPGLILKVWDSKHEYQFEATFIENKPKYSPMIKFIKGRYVTTSRERINEALVRIHRDLLQAYEMILGFRPQVVGTEASVISVPYNPIEQE